MKRKIGIVATSQVTDLAKRNEGFRVTKKLYLVLHSYEAMD